MEYIDLLEKISSLEGNITISFILYTKPKTARVFLDFLVVNSSSTYNDVLERPTLIKLEVITSI